VSPAITVEQSGLLYITLYNRSNSTNFVYFDDLTVTQAHSRVVVGSDFYPFGLAMDGTEITDEPYRYGYQGQFSEKDLNTGWNEFELRMYDARFGRWLSPDPYGQFASPYAGMGNNPPNGFDSDGGLWGMGSVASGAVIGAGVGAAAGAIYGLATDKENWGLYALGGAAGGALIGVLGGALYNAATLDIPGAPPGRMGLRPKNSRISGASKTTNLRPVTVIGNRISNDVTFNVVIALAKINMPSKMPALNINSRPPTISPPNLMETPDPDVGFGSGLEKNFNFDIDDNYYTWQRSAREDALIEFLKSNHHKIRYIEVIIDIGNTPSTNAQVESVKSKILATITRWRIPKSKVRFKMERKIKPKPGRKESKIKIRPYG
jgi:RHS repeat-associated protein